MHTNNLLKFLTIGLLVLSGSSHALAAPYRFEQLTGPVGGWEATAINGSGQIAGAAGDPIGYAIQAGTWTDGNLTLLERTATSSRALAINDQGQVAGEIWTPITGRTAAVWSNNTQTILARTSETTSQYATGINNSSLVVGNRSQDYERTFQAVTWRNYDVKPLDMLGATSSYATGVNNTGQISGYLQYVSGSSTVTQAVVWNGDQVTQLLATGGNACCAQALAISNTGVVVGDVFGNGTSMPVYWQGTEAATPLAAPTNGGQALGINSLGQAVGTGFVGPWGVALLWDLTTGQYTDLNTYLTTDQVAAGWVLNRAVAINDVGDIVGIAYNTKQASFRPFALMAIPEPSTLVYMSLGLLALGLQHRRSRL